MLGSISVLLLSSTAFHAVGALPQASTSTNTTNAYLAIDSEVLGNDMPDPRFSVDTTFEPDFLPPIPTLMSVLVFMGEMAYTDFNARVPARTWIAPGYPDIEISTIGPIKAKYLVFGVYAGIEYMIKYNRFHEVMFTMRWNKQMVGRIWMTLPGFAVPGLPANGTFSGNSTEQTDAFLTIPGNATSIDAELPIQDSRNSTNFLGIGLKLEIDTIAPGRKLNRNFVFLACYEALAKIAPSPQSAQMADFVVSSSLGGISMHFIHWGPGIKNYRVIQVLSFIPKTMIVSPPGFREVNVSVFEEDIMVLEISIKKITPQGNTAIA
ncbi:hypothetical protein ACLMJK_009125 [Lecanora helva]